MSKLSTQKDDIGMGRRLTAVRMASGLSQLDFAESVKVSGRAYAGYERGERELPVALFRTLVEQRGIDPFWLLSGPGQSPQMTRGRKLEEKLLETIFQMVEEWQDQNRKVFKPAKKARLIRLLYEHCIELEDVKVDPVYVNDMLLLAA